MASYYRQKLENYLNELDVKVDSVLDIGGGAKPVNGRTKSWNVKEYRIADNNLEGSFDPDYYIDLNNKDAEIFKEYSMVFCLEVFEYIWNPVVALENIYMYLNNGGKAIISFPSIYPVHNPKEYDYLRYTKKWIEKASEDIGFKIIKITPRVATEGHDYLQTFYSKEKMHAVKNDDVIFDLGYIVEVQK